MGSRLSRWSPEFPGCQYAQCRQVRPPYVCRARRALARCHSRWLEQAAPFNGCSATAAPGDPGRRDERMSFEFGVKHPRVCGRRLRAVHARFRRHGARDLHFLAWLMRIEPKRARSFLHRRRALRSAAMGLPSPGAGRRPMRPPLRSCETDDPREDLRGGVAAGGCASSSAANRPALRASLRLWVGRDR